MTKPLPIWLRGERIKREVADVTDHWLRRFKRTHLGDVRKEDAWASNSRCLYRVSAVLAALEAEGTNE